MSGTTWFANEIRGRHVLIGMIAFFGLIFLANGIFLYYALTTFGGGEKGSPYRSGLRYNETLAEAARAAERGLEGRLSYDARAGAARPSRPCTPRARNGSRSSPR